ncbi:MAG TPA: ferritin [Acidobacteriota bacterium]|nr:ferritin [Acidobacteriota bacterium]
MLSDRMREAINDQINAELYSAYLYLSMAGHCEAVNLPGFASWMKQQAKEEVTHAMKLFEYLNDRGTRVALKAIAEPPLEFASPVDIFQQTLDHEKAVTDRINRLYAMALEENDYATQNMLQWFIEEQVEEEKTASQVLEQLKRVGDQGTALVIMDRYLAERKD